MCQPRSEFRSVTESIPQDWASLAQFLAGFDLALGSTPPRQFDGGFGNLNYLIELDGKPAVLRRPPGGPLPPGANDMTREYRILSRLWQAYPLAPRALFYSAEPHVLGAPFQIIEYRPGIVIRDILPPDAAALAQVGAVLSRHLIDSLVALHALDPGQIGLETLGRATGFLGRTLEGWVTRGSALIDLVNPLAFGEVVKWLRKGVPAEVSPSLIHSDFKLDNIILEPTTFTPVAVIDWDMGTRGDPLWDLAILLSYWVEVGDPECMQRIRQMPTAQPGFLRRCEVLTLYQQLSGRAVDDFTFYRVLSVFRSAIVFLQLFDRYRRDPERNMRCSEFDALGRGLLDYSFEIAHGRAE